MLPLLIRSSCYYMPLNRVQPIRRRQGKRHRRLRSTTSEEQCQHRGSLRPQQCIFVSSGQINWVIFASTDPTLGRWPVSASSTQTQGHIVHTLRSSITRVFRTSRGVVKAAATPPAMLPQTAASWAYKGFRFNVIDNCLLSSS